MANGKARRIFRGIFRFFIKGTIGLAVLVGLLMLWTIYLNRPPRIKITQPHMPAVNAYDTFRQASKAMRNFSALPATRYYWRGLDLQAIDKKTLAMIPSEEQHANIPQQRKAAPPLAPIFAENQPALALIRQGLQLEFATPLNSQEKQVDYHAIGQCHKLLESYALYTLLNADAYVAASALVDLMHYDTLTNVGSREHTDGHGYEQLDVLLEDLSADDARKLTARLEEVCRIRLSYAEAMEKARPYELDDLTMMLAEKNFIRWYTPR